MLASNRARLAGRGVTTARGEQRERDDHQTQRQGREKSVGDLECQAQADGSHGAPRREPAGALEALGRVSWRRMRKIHGGILTYDGTGLKDMWSRLRSAERSAYLALAVGTLGMALRGLLSAASTGTNDIITWEAFAHYANREGVLGMYGNLPGWNHPPLTGYLAAELLRLSMLTGLRFPVVFKLVPMAADALCLVLLWKIWRHRSAHSAAPLAAVAIFSFSPDAILVSAYHGNNDSLVGLFILAACYFVEEKASFVWAGVALAAAVNVKLIPLLLVPVFLANVRRWREAACFLGGLSVGAIPFIPVLLRAGTAFHRNAIAYNSNFDNWGIPFFIRLGEDEPQVGRRGGSTSRLLRPRRPVPGPGDHPGPLRVEPLAPSALDVSTRCRGTGSVSLSRARLWRPVHRHPGSRSRRLQPGMGPLVRGFDGCLHCLGLLPVLDPRGAARLSVHHGFSLSVFMDRSSCLGWRGGVCSLTGQGSGFREPGTLNLMHALGERRVAIDSDAVPLLAAAVRPDDADAG